MTDRVSIDVEGFGHANPIPAASRIGRLLMSGVLTGRDPDTRAMPTGLDEQCRHLFGHVRTLMATAGGGIDDIVKMTFWLVDYRDRAALNAEWLAMFPNPASRPARQAMAAALDGGCLVQCDLVAVLPDRVDGVEGVEA